VTTDQSIQNLRPRSSFSTWIGVVLVFAFFGLLVLVVIGASPRGTDYEKKRAKARSEKLQTLRDETTTALTTYGWVDKTKGVARIPINDAMKLTMAELAQKKPAPANPIAPEAQAPAAQNGAPLTATPPATSPVPSGTGTPKPTAVTGPSSESRAQPAAADNPPGASPGTQPGPSATPAASAGSAAARPPQSPSSKPSPSPSAAGSPLPVRGKTP
jgi:hypothetical protein